MVTGDTIKEELTVKRTYELLGEVSLERGKGAQMLRLDLRVHAAPVIICIRQILYFLNELFFANIVPGYANKFHFFQITIICWNL